jgi:RNA polymerase sigma-54 factor
MTNPQSKLSLSVSQRQILTPGLMQMVTVLALNKLELKEMLQTEMVENPLLEELEDGVPLLDDVDSRNEQLDRPAETQQLDAAREKADPFDEIDFGSYFRDYLDPGFRPPNCSEVTEKPSIENFLSQPSTLTDHLLWQIGSLTCSPGVRNAAEYIVGNLNEDGYLDATQEELLEGYLWKQLGPETPADLLPHDALKTRVDQLPQAVVERAKTDLASALVAVRQLDPVGVAAPDLRGCLLVQVEAHQREMICDRQSSASHRTVFELAHRIVDKHLMLLQKRDLRDLAKAIGTPVEAVQQATEFVRTLDPRPAQRYNRSEARLIEPDVAFVKHDDEYVVAMDEDGLPALRLNQGYRNLLTQNGAEKEVKEYVKERYRSAIQLLRNIDQRKNTILRTCESIIRWQRDFLEKGVDAIKPMMIKDIAEEIGVHPSTVSRAVSNKYVHTPQGVFELRFFFSEGASGPVGANTPLMLLKRKVKKLIQEEDSHHPLTDDQIANILQPQGIHVTRRSVAKYREDMRIPSTHRRRMHG